MIIYVSFCVIKVRAWVRVRVGKGRSVVVGARFDVYGQAGAFGLCYMCPYAAYGAVGYGFWPLD